VSDLALGRASKFFNLDLWEDVRLPFILSPKASRKEKEAGLNQVADKIVKEDYRICENNVPYKIRPEARNNPHPTVKPLKLMSYLITLDAEKAISCWTLSVALGLLVSLL
jgi:site-specific DNA-methyltransferase (adenine-specific)